MVDDLPSGPLLLFDGVCVLCLASVRFVLKHDRQALFRFASQQSVAGQALLGAYAIKPDVSVYLVHDGRVYQKSDAVLETLRLLGYPWRIFGVFGYLPRGSRDAVYDFIGNRRYKWFGRLEACPLPDPAERSRFLD